MTIQIIERKEKKKEGWKKKRNKRKKVIVSWFNIQSLWICFSSSIVSSSLAIMSSSLSSSFKLMSLHSNSWSNTSSFSWKPSYSIWILSKLVFVLFVPRYLQIPNNIRYRKFTNTEYYSFKKIYEYRIPNSIRNLKINEYRKPNTIH